MTPHPAHDDGRSDRQDRSAFRAFVRDHHPDRGGDPEAFVAGLARFGKAGSGHDDHHGDQHHSDRHHDRRYDAPVEIVPTPSFPVRVGIALIRTWHRRRHHRVE